MANNYNVSPIDAEVYDVTIIKGDKGDKGDTGSTPDISIGTVTTLSPGSNATVSVSGTPEQPVMSFGIPQGDKGDTGDTGATGKSAYQDAVDNGYTGTQAQFGTYLANVASDLAEIENITATAATLPAGSNATASYSAGLISLGIPKGDKGDTGNTGATGATPQISVAATTLSAGSSATAAVSGTAASPLITFGIPKGDKGDTGNTGATGATPAFSVGTVTTLAAGASATATITGTDAAPVLNLGVPQGLKGDTGNGDMIADDFSTSTAYAAGDYAIYNGHLYRFTAAHAAGAWTGTDAVQVQLAEDVTDLKSALTTEGGINSFAVDSYNPTWNLWDGSWGLSNNRPTTGANVTYMVFGAVVPVVGGNYYSVGVLNNPLYGTKVNVVGLTWMDSNRTAIGSNISLYPQGGYISWKQAPSNAVYGYIYFNSNNASVSITPEDIYNAGIKAFFASRIVNFTNRDSTGQYAIKASEWIPSFLVSTDAVEHTVTHIVSVGPTNSNFTSLRAALDDISAYGYPSEYNRFEVRIKEGTYDIASYFTAAEKATAGFVGLIVPDWITLKGVGNREKTILQYVLETASNNICVLNLQNTCSLENLTLYGVKTRYCVHDDKANYIGTPYKRFCKNVHFKGDTMTLGAVYGSGINSNAEWIFEDCIFESLTQTGYQNCFSVHGSGQAVQVGSSSVTFDNCRFIGYGTNNSVILSTLMNNASYFQNYCKFRGCSANGRLILREENASSYGAGIAWWATGFATTFTDEIISNTDGIDYSDHIDII